MGKRKYPKEDPVEKLEKEVRELKSINRSLMKRIKKLNRGYRKEREEPKKEIEEKKPEPVAICPECGKGEVISHEILNRTWEECNSAACSWRTETKIM